LNGSLVHLPSSGLEPFFLFRRKFKIKTDQQHPSHKMTDKAVSGTQTAAAAAEQSRLSHDSDVKVFKVQQVEGIDATHATIMATNKPNQWGKGYIRLYMLAACIFLNSTMNGPSP
jgi:hypothetical protein